MTGRRKKPRPSAAALIEPVEPVQSVALIPRQTALSRILERVRVAVGAALDLADAAAEAVTKSLQQRS